MANASKDENSVSSLLGTLNSDGKTPIPVLADPTTHRLKVRFGTTGSNNGPTNAPKDGNDVSCLLGVSNADGKTPVVIYADADGRLLLNAS